MALQPGLVAGGMAYSAAKESSPVTAGIVVGGVVLVAAVATLAILDVAQSTKNAITNFSLPSLKLPDITIPVPEISISNDFGVDVGVSDSGWVPDIGFDAGTGWGPVI